MPTRRCARPSRRAWRATSASGWRRPPPSVLGVPLMRAMRERYPDVRLHLVESLSGHLAAMLNARQLDLAVLFETERGAALERDAAAGGKAVPDAAARPARPADRPPASRMAQLAGVPLILPSGAHGLRARSMPRLPGRHRAPAGGRDRRRWRMLMDAVRAGLGCHHPARRRAGAAARTLRWLQWCEIADAQVRRRNLLVQPVGRRAVARRAGRARGAGRRARARWCAKGAGPAPPFTNPEDPLP